MTPYQNAVRNGDARYIGRPCKWGHSGERYTSHGGCVECAHSRDFTKMQLKDKSVIIADVGGNKFMGAPCSRGHSGLRYKKSFTCVECHLGSGLRTLANKANRAARAKRMARSLPITTAWDDLLG